MIIEEQRYLHEDIERIEQGIADRLVQEPKNIRDRLNRDHEVSQLLDQIQKQSTALLELYKDSSNARAKELDELDSSDSWELFYSLLREIRDHHARYPNEQAENVELLYKPRPNQPYIVDSLFSGEEAFGRFFDLNPCHEVYLNLPTVKRLSYLQYLDAFDKFKPGQGGLKRGDKLSDQYSQYLDTLSEYLESFMRRTRPLEDVDKLLRDYDEEFEKKWANDEVEGWKQERLGSSASGANGSTSTPDAVYCPDCEKEFKKTVYNSHLSGRKHIRAAEQRKARILEASNGGNVESDSMKKGSSPARLKEQAVAQKEHRIAMMTAAMATERSDTHNNVERKQGMTERERQQELENLLSLSSGGVYGNVKGASYMRGKRRGGPGTRAAGGFGDDEDDEDDEDDKVYNPLKLPLAWDGKPIPFWLWRLHGLGVEFTCEICGNFVYMGRRAFDKHFNEARHIYGLKCLGITQTNLFRDITEIEQALALWDKIKAERNKGKVDDGSIVQMEDAEGNVMPEKVYYDLQKQGLL